MESTARDDTREPQAQPPQDSDKLVMRSVVSHDRLLGMIEQRNPIIAQRDRQR